MTPKSFEELRKGFFPEMLNEPRDDEMMRKFYDRYVETTKMFHKNNVSIELMRDDSGVLTAVFVVGSSITEVEPT